MHPEPLSSRKTGAIAGGQASLGEALRLGAPALLLVLVVLVPFHDKAFTIDDTLFLKQAAQLLRDPLHPTAFETIWSDVPERLSRIMPSGPVMAWLLLPAVRRPEQLETVAHLMVLALLGLAVLSTVRLARRLGMDAATARLSGLLLAVTPACLGMAATAMPDVPAMALGVAALERGAAWKAEGRWHQACATALSFALSVLARSHLLFMTPALILLLWSGSDPFALQSWRRVPKARWLPVVGGLAVVLVVLRLTRDPALAGAHVMGSATGFLTYHYLDRNILAFGIHWVVALPLGLPWLLLRGRAIRWRSLAPPIVVVVTLLSLLADGWTQLWTVPLASLGLVVVGDILRDAVQRRDPVHLVLGLCLLVAVPVVGYVHMPPKYQLASAPAVAILVAEAARTSGLGSRLVERLLVPACLVIGLGLGVLIIRADARFAEIGRRAVQTLIPPYVREGRQVWFIGHWGFQWYAEQAGARCLTTLPPYPRAGDVIVVSRGTAVTVGDLLERLPHGQPLATFSDPALTTAGGVVMSRSAGAGFFSTYWGYLPWGWQAEPPERIEVWQVMATPPSESSTGKAR